MFELPTERPEGLDRAYVPKLIRAMTPANVFLYKLTNGSFGSTWRVGAAWHKPVPVCLLTTIGKKSGEPRTAALLCMPDGDRVVIVASQGGLPKNPLWYGNILANPDVTIQLGKKVAKYRARTANATERAALWPRLVDLYADFAKYAQWTTREIPVVVCEPVAG